MPASARARICVVGSGSRFLSGISTYTVRLANALAGSHDVSAITMRQLLPSRLYPGRARVGAKLTDLAFAPSVRAFDGVDWHWLPSLFRALDFLRRERPEVVVFQWWTGAVLHSYLALAAAARLLGARVVIEFHEVQDTGEARLPLARAYVGADRDLLARHYPIDGRPLALIPHGPYEHYARADRPTARREAPTEACNLLFFGVIRPYKGLEDLVAAFDAIPDDEIGRYWLTVIGETWEGWTLPAERIAASRHRDRITFVNRYVSDEEVAGYFAGADERW
jgi:glycosyltransferase involved in cell wall biosynthesis